MTTSSSSGNILAEVWTIKDSLSAGFGHDLKATCRALYAEQQKHPSDFLNLGTSPRQNKTLLPTDGTAVITQSSAA